MSSPEEEDTEVPPYKYTIWFDAAVQPVDGVSVTPSVSPTDSPGASPSKEVVTMAGDEENIRVHFQARKVARGKLTSRKKALLNLLDTRATGNDMTASRNVFQQ